MTPGVTVDGGQIVRRGATGATPLLPRARPCGCPAGTCSAMSWRPRPSACVAGVPPAAMRRAVEGFNGLEHALERVAEIDGVRFVNDSKATNVVSARRAIESFDRGVVAIMGGRFKGGDFADLREAVAHACDGDRGDRRGERR